MGGMTQTLTGAAMTDNYEKPATRGDLRNALIRIESKFDSLRTGIDTRFLGIERCFVGIEQRFVDLERQFGKAGRLHRMEFVMIMLGFLGIILNLQ
jgi:hypothetical protein